MNLVGQRVDEDGRVHDLRLATALDFVEVAENGDQPVASVITSAHSAFSFTGRSPTSAVSMPEIQNGALAVALLPLLLCPCGSSTT